MVRWYTPLTCLALALGAVRAAPEGPAPVGLPGESVRTARRLEEADKLAAARKWGEAVAE